MFKTISDHRAFIIYIIFATIYLGMQMFQGFSFLDIGIYMSGYQHFSNEPHTTYYLGQWLLTYQLSSLICKALTIKTFLGIRLLHLALTILSQTVIYFYLRQYVRPRHIIAGLTLATLAHFGSYTEINYNDYSIFLLTLSILAAHHGMTRSRAFAIMLSGAFAGFAILFRIVNLTFLALPVMIWLVSLRRLMAIGTRKICFAFFTGAFLGLAL
ncbi:MAG: glycosyltransferase family 39 protein, partial [Prevotella sp.]